MRGLIDAARAWLPHPVYRFVGGPADGKRLAVELVERSYGMVPPEFWRVAGKRLPPGIKPERVPKAMAEDMAYRVHTYRFVPLAGSINEGHYEHVD